MLRNAIPALLGTALLLTGCASSLRSYRVGDKPTRFQDLRGLVYYLPKSLLVIKVPYSLIEATPIVPKPKKGPPPKATPFRFVAIEQPIEVSTRIVADRRLAVAVDVDGFTNQTSFANEMKITLDPQGLLASVNATASDRVAGAVNGALKVAAAAVPLVVKAVELVGETQMTALPATTSDGASVSRPPTKKKLIATAYKTYEVDVMGDGDIEPLVADKLFFGTESYKIVPKVYAEVTLGKSDRTFRDLGGLPNTAIEGIVVRTPAAIPVELRVDAYEAEPIAAETKASAAKNFEQVLVYRQPVNLVQFGRWTKLAVRSRPWIDRKTTITIVDGVLKDYGIDEKHGSIDTEAVTNAVKAVVDRQKAVEDEKAAAELKTLTMQRDVLEMRSKIQVLEKQIEDAKKAKAKE